MIRDRTHPSADKATTRLEAFTDGVFAIAATLLVLDLTTHALGEVSWVGSPAFLLFLLDRPLTRLLAPRARPA